MFLNPISFKWNYCVKQKRHGPSYQFFSRLSNMFNSVFSLVIHNPTIFDILIQRGFDLFQKLQLVIYQVISFWHNYSNFNFLFNSKDAQQEEELQKINCTRTKEISMWNKKHFPWYFKGSFLRKYIKILETNFQKLDKFLFTTKEFH